MLMKNGRHDKVKLRNTYPHTESATKVRQSHPGAWVSRVIHDGYLIVEMEGGRMEFTKNGSND